MVAMPRESPDAKAIPEPSGPPHDDARMRLDGLARRYYGPLASFFHKRTRNADDVQDLVQQVFLRLAQSPRFDEIRNPEGYIFQTAANALKDHARRRSVRERFSAGQPLENDDEHSEFSPERILQGRESVSRVADALRQLPERTRDVFVLRCFEGLKCAEIGRLQGISVRAVEKHLAKALVHLTQALEWGRAGVSR
jgi:RNA polymerase sigma factor (sigma-70 family)